MIHYFIYLYFIAFIKAIKIDKYENDIEELPYDILSMSTYYIDNINSRTDIYWSTGCITNEIEENLHFSYMKNIWDSGYIEYRYELGQSVGNSGWWFYWCPTCNKNLTITDNFEQNCSNGIKCKYICNCMCPHCN